MLFKNSGLYLITPNNVVTGIWFNITNRQMKYPGNINMRTYFVCKSRQLYQSFILHKTSFLMHFYSERLNRRPICTTYEYRKRKL